MLLAWCLPAVASAQTQVRESATSDEAPRTREDETPSQATRPTRVTRAAGAATGAIGQRRLATEDRNPLARVDTRLQNRVQLRLQTRVGPVAGRQTDIRSAAILTERRARVAGTRARR